MSNEPSNAPTPSYLFRDANAEVHEVYVLNKDPFLDFYFVKEVGYPHREWKIHKDQFLSKI